MQLVSAETGLGRGHEGDDIPDGGVAASSDRPGVCQATKETEREDIKGPTECGCEAPEGEDQRED